MSQEPTTSEFWSPSYQGGRFEDHTLPLNLLEDLAALQDLLVEVAKSIYYEENERNRVPNGFTEGVSLKLSGIGEGSTIPKLFLALSTVGSLSTQDKLQYYIKAKDRIIECVNSLNSPQQSNLVYWDQYLHYFHRIGKNLYQDEVLDLYPRSENLNGKLTFQTRTRVANILDNRTTEQFTIIGSIPIVDKAKKIFTLDSVGTRIVCKYNPAIARNVYEVFNGFDDGVRAKIVGQAVFNHEYRLSSFEQVTEFTVIQPANISKRIDALMKLENGWFDGEGIAPEVELLKRVRQELFEKFDINFCIDPKIYPTPNGGVRLEWSNSEMDYSVLIDPTGNEAYLHMAFLKNNDDSADFEEKVVLTTTNSWHKVFHYAHKYFPL